MKDFSAFLDMRSYKNWAHIISSRAYLTVWRPVLPVFPWAQSALFLLSTLNSLLGCWRSAAAAAHNLILVEGDGKHPGQVPICSWQTWLRTIDQKTTSQRAVSNWGGPRTYEFFGWEIHVVRQEMTAHPKKHISQVNDFTVFLYIFCT